MAGFANKLMGKANGDTKDARDTCGLSPIKMGTASRERGGSDGREAITMKRKLTTRKLSRLAGLVDMPSWCADSQ